MGGAADRRLTTTGTNLRLPQGGPETPRHGLQGPGRPIQPVFTVVRRSYRPGAGTPGYSSGLCREVSIPGCTPTLQLSDAAREVVADAAAQTCSVLSTRHHPQTSTTWKKTTLLCACVLCVLCEYMCVRGRGRAANGAARLVPEQSLFYKSKRWTCKLRSWCGRSESEPLLTHNRT